MNRPRADAAVRVRGPQVGARVIETGRLTLRRLTVDDAAFMLALLNEPSFIRNIGDRGIRTIAAARDYITKGPLASYAANGFGLLAVGLGQAPDLIGICGLLKRQELPDPDLGFALLPAYWSRGYASEAAGAVLAHAREQYELKRVLALASPDNTASVRVLEKLGFAFERMFRFAGADTELKLFASGV